MLSEYSVTCFTAEVVFTVQALTSVSPPAAFRSGSQRDSDHPGDFPGLEEEEKAGEGWDTFKHFINTESPYMNNLKSITLSQRKLCLQMIRDIIIGFYSITKS